MTQASASVTRMSPDQVRDRLQAQADLHFSKTQNSAQAFKNARVTSCSKVLMNGGHTVAVAFPSPIPKNVDINAMKSSEVTALSQ